MTYDAQDRIETSGDATYTFDANGDLEERFDADTQETTRYTYDALGSLLRVELADGRIVDYLVDPSGRRVAKSVDSVRQKAWIWSGGLQPVAQLDATGAVTQRYVYSLGTSPSLIVTPSATYRLIKDHLGSVRMVVDTATGAVVQELEYDSWGSVLVDTNPGFQPFGYAGGLYDADTGLVRFGARDYDAETGRWLTKDPIGLSGGLDVYGYAGAEPVNRSDPTGKDFCVYECSGGVSTHVGAVRRRLGSLLRILARRLQSARSL